MKNGAQHTKLVNNILFVNLDLADFEHCYWWYSPTRN